MGRGELGTVGIRIIINAPIAPTPPLSSPTTIGDPVNLSVRSTQTIEIKSIYTGFPIKLGMSWMRIGHEIRYNYEKYNYSGQ